MNNEKNNRFIMESGDFEIVNKNGKDYSLSNEELKHALEETKKNLLEQFQKLSESSSKNSNQVDDDIPRKVR